MIHTFFIFGVSGVGKTTVISPLKSLVNDNFEIHDFDERGVPDNAGRNWRIEETKYWINLGIDNKRINVTTVICGFARPSESRNISDIGFILLDADADTIKKRLLNRYPTPESVEIIERVSSKSLEQFIDDNINFSSVLREEAEGYGLPIIKTDNISPGEVAYKAWDCIRNYKQNKRQ